MRISKNIIGQRVAVACANDATAQAEWLLDQVAMMVERGLRLHDGATMSFGWVTLTFKLVAGELLLHEPDFSAMPPIGLRADVTCSLQVQGNMLSVVRSEGVQPMFSTYRQRVVVGAEAWDASNVMMSRLRTPTKDDSGWLVLGRGIKRSKRLEEVEVCELLNRKPAWLMGLALPVGCIVEVSGDKISAIGRGSGLE